MGMSRLRRRDTLALAFGIFAAGATTARAQAVDEIRKRGVVRIGILGGEPPWGFTDEKGNPVGVDIDVSNLLAKEMGVRMEFERVIVTSRIPTLVTGKVDMLIASMGMFPDRAKVVQFSRPYVANVNIVVAAKDKHITSYADLLPYKVGVNRGNAVDIGVTQNAPRGTQIMRFDDDASVVQALRAGQVDAIGLSPYPLQMLQRQASTGNYEEKIVVNDQWTGVATRKGQCDLNTWLDASLNKAEAAGQLNDISRRWLGKDAPPFPKSLPGITFTCEG